MEEKINLLKKIKALSESGSSGEKENAEILLMKMLKKHGLTIHDIDTPDQETNKFYFRKNDPIEEYLLYHIIASVINDDRNVYTNKDRRSKSFFEVEVSNSEKVEILCKFDFFLSRLHKSIELFLNAFILKNGLIKQTKEKPSEKPNPDDLKKVIEFYKSLDREHFHKQLSM